jgi:hypothetical protein
MMRAEKTGRPPSPEEGGTSPRQFVENDKTDTASEKGRQGPYPGPIGAQFISGAARYGSIYYEDLRSGRELTELGERPPAMCTLHGLELVTFRVYNSATAVKEAMRRRWRWLATRGIVNPKEAIGPVRLTERASLSARGMELQRKLEKRGLKVERLRLSKIDRWTPRLRLVPADVTPTGAPHSPRWRVAPVVGRVGVRRSQGWHDKGDDLDAA